MSRVQLLLFSVVLCLTSMVSLAGADRPSWPQWRGPQRTGLSNEAGLLKQWPEAGPHRLWLFQSAGIGFSGPAIVHNRLYIMGSRGGAEQLIALDSRSGSEIWSVGIGPEYENRWGNGPRGTPTCDGDFVYALGAQGDLIAVQATDGAVLWRRKMQDFGGSLPNWGYCESVLVDGPQIVCTPGGTEGAIVALEKQNGNLIWQSSEFTDEAQYASLIVTEINGIRQYLQMTQEHLVAIAAGDGSLVWQTDWRGSVAVCTTPICDGNRVYVTSGYGAGCKLVEISPDNSVLEVFDNKFMKNHHGGAILLNNHVYGYSDGVGWLCQNFESGERVWRNRDEFGKGSIAYADGMFYCLDKEEGIVALVDASPEHWNERGRFTLDPQSQRRKPSGRIWTHPVIVDGRLYLRDQELLFCYDVKQP